MKIYRTPQSKILATPMTSAWWQVTLCDPTRHMSSRSGEASYELLYSVYLYLYLLCFEVATLCGAWHLLRSTVRRAKRTWTWKTPPSSSSTRSDWQNSAEIYCSTLYLYDTIRYDTRCYFNVRSKADISQLNLPHGTDN